MHAPGGFGPDAMRGLTALERIERDEGEPLRLMFEGLGSSALFDTITPLVGEAAVWHKRDALAASLALKKPQMRVPRLDARQRAAKLTGRRQSGRE